MIIRRVRDLDGRYQFYSKERVIDLAELEVDPQFHMEKGESQVVPKRDKLLIEEVLNDV